MTSAAPLDAGLQPERTSLAWRRTALAVALGSIVSLRVLTAVLDHPFWFTPGVIGVCFAGWMWWVSHHRHTALARQLASSSGGAALGASALLTLAIFVVAVGAVGIIVVLSG